MGQAGPDEGAKIETIKTYLRRNLPDFSIHDWADRHHRNHYIMLYRVQDGASHKVTITRRFLDGCQTPEAIQGFVDEHALSEKIRRAGAQLITVDTSEISLHTPR